MAKKGKNWQKKAKIGLNWQKYMISKSYTLLKNIEFYSMSTLNAASLRTFRPKNHVFIES